MRVFCVLFFVCFALLIDNIYIGYCSTFPSHAVCHFEVQGRWEEEGRVMHAD